MRETKQVFFLVIQTLSPVSAAVNLKTRPLSTADNHSKPWLRFINPNIETLTRHFFVT